MPHVLIVVGTRPNFIKVTQFKRCAEKYPEMQVELVHTGQHFDDNMANVFFQQFELTPDYFLDVPPADPARQVSEIISRLADLIEKVKPDLVMAVGDVNSTMAAAITANKMGIPLAHLESGLRSFDRSMPEEHNRMVTDVLADLFFVTERSGLENLSREGRERGVHFVGNTMIDTLCAFEEKIEESPILDELTLESGMYILTTIHRPATVDNAEGLEKMIEVFRRIGRFRKIVFPIHPRTVRQLKSFELWDELRGLKDLTLTDPLGYFPFQKLISHSAWVLTDSGGIQEETTFRQKPCLTLRPNTERPVTLAEGTNTLVEFDADVIEELAFQIESGNYKEGTVPELWDGQATERVIAVMQEFLK